MSDLTRAKWNVAVEEAYRTQLQKQQVCCLTWLLGKVSSPLPSSVGFDILKLWIVARQTEIQGEIKKAEGQGKPPDMSEDEWNSVVKRLKAVEQAIKEQNDQARGNEAPVLYNCLRSALHCI